MLVSSHQLERTLIQVLLINTTNQNILLREDIAKRVNRLALSSIIQ